MMRSLFTAITGLNTHQNKMDVIGNNVANVNTVAFKSSRVTFADVFYQTTQGGSGANENTGRGGTNPIQVGLGVGLSSIDTQMSQGAAQNTGNELDLMINGDSFFIVGDSSGTYFTRSGAFRLDNEQNIVTSSGYKLYGWNSVFNPTTGQYEIQRGAVSALNVLSGEHLTALGQSTSKTHFEGNLSAADSVVDPTTGLGKVISQNLTFYDTLGNAYTMDVDFRLVNPAIASAADPSFNVGATDSNYNNWQVTLSNNITVNGQQVTTPGITGNPFYLQFDQYGKLVNLDAGSPESTGVIFDLTNFITSVENQLGIVTDFGPFIDENGVTHDHSFLIDFSDVTATTGKTSIKGDYDNGYSGGELTDWSIGANGIITGVYSNGEVRVLGQVAVANFLNPMGLEKVGDNMYQTTANSGGFNGIGDDVTFGGGSFIPGSLEMSNVDLSTEFTEMITTQRGFQANSRIITTSDELLQELVQLKR